MKQLRYLSLGSTVIGDDELKPLAKLEHLHTLHLRGTRVTDAGLVTLAGMRQLRDLQLASTKITDLKELASLSEIEELELSACTLIVDSLRPTGEPWCGVR